MKEGGRLVSLVFATVIAMKLSEDTVRLYSVSSNTSTCRWIMEAFHHVLRSVCSSPEELKTYYQLFLEVRILQS